MNNNVPRVLHIDTETSWGGGQQQVAYLLERLHEKGYATTLICQPESSIARYCQKNALPFFNLHMRGEVDIYAGYKIAGICRKNNFNILHLHSAHALSIGLWAKLFYRNIKLIGVRRMATSFKNNFFSRMKYTNPMIDRLICISDHIRATLKEGINEDRLVTIHSGVDLKKFERISPPPDFKKQLGIPEHHILVGTVASLVDPKDYPNLLHAARIVLDSTENISFIAVGTGSQKDKIMRLARKLQLGQRFIFAGFRADVGAFLNSFDIFVLSSISEGLGTSILDAQAVGLPVIACRTGGIPELVQHNINGLLVPTKNPGSLAEAILDLACNGNKRRQLGGKAKETVTRFSIENTIQMNLDLYKQLLN